jgi:hypothetical protein
MGPAIKLFSRVPFFLRDAHALAGRGLSPFRVYPFFFTFSSSLFVFLLFFSHFPFLLFKKIKLEQN